jgi:hypothetical protein
MSPMIRKALHRGLSCALSLALLSACKAQLPAGRSEGSAVLGASGDVAALGPVDLETLRRAGVREVFVEAGHLGWEKGWPSLGTRFEVPPGFSAPRLPVSLSVRGEWERFGDSTPAAAAGEALVEDVLRRVREATAAGLAVVGIHLDLALGEGVSASAYGEAVAALREGLPEDLYLAVSLDPALLRSPEAKGLTAASDVIVPFLFGPRAAGRPGPRGDEAWSLDGLEDDMARLDELGTPYLVGVGTVGGVARNGGGGDLFTATSLGSLLRDRALDPRPAPLFGSADAQLYPFVARRPTRLGDWDLTAGDEIEARRLAPHHLRALVERVEAVGSPLHLGQLYDRLPRPGEGLALTPAELAAAADPAAAAPRLELVLERAGGGLRVGLAHRGGAATEIAAFDHNYVEVRLAGGSFGAVDPGGFARYELLVDGRRVADQAALRRADTLRLYTPFLEAGDEVASGVVRHSGAATATARFLMPDGAVVEAAPEE